MSKATQGKSEEQSVAISEVVYTICPVLVASHVAVEKGWLEEELQNVGVSLRYLRSLAPEYWLAHFTHRLPAFFRDGGNIPAIWTKAEGVETTLLGLTFSGDGGQILVRADSGIKKVSDLKNRKIGLLKRLNEDRVDFWRATAERGIRLALDIADLTDGRDVAIVDLPVGGPDYVSTEPLQKPTKWNSSQFFRVEVDALLEGKVDAIYSNHGRSISLQAEGKVKVIEDLARYPDWTLQVANTPYTITVDTALAENHPEIVIAYLRAAVKAGRWINSHPAEAGEIFAGVTSFPCGPCASKTLEKRNLVPSLSGKNIAGIEIEKQFLLERGYIQHDFDAHAWIDGSLLEEALKENQ